MTATLPQLFALPPGSGRLPDRPREMPYATVESKLDRRESTGTGGAWHDHRKVTIRVWGKKADVVQALRALTARFNLQTVLAYPSGARFLRWWPTGGPRLEEDPQRKAGEDVWVGTVEADAWSIRTV